MVYVMSDIHGNRRRFDSVMKQINLTAEDTLYILGDVIDRHPDGISILEQIMRSPNIKMLPGNHEHMMLTAIDPLYSHYTALKFQQMEALRRWYRNGGMVTHEAIQKAGAQRREKICEFLRSLPLSYDVEVNGISYKLVHAFPAELYGNYHYEYSDERTFAVWHRYRPGDIEPEDYILVFGHTPTEEYQSDNPLRIYRGRRVIGMDCGAGFDETTEKWLDMKGNLACLCLDDNKEYYSEEDTENEKEGESQ